MEKFEYDGDIYYFANNKFYDEHFIQVDKITLDKISHEYTKNIDYKSLNMDELFERDVWTGKRNGYLWYWKVL